MSKILIVEDDPLFAETLCDLLELEGYLFDLAPDAQSAFDLTFEHRYSLYLLDVKLPGASGFDFLNEMRSSGDQTPALFLTSLQDRESLSQGFRAGGDDFMRKPPDLEEMLLRIKALIRRSQNLHEMLYIGEEVFDCENLTVTGGEATHKLKPQEAKLLVLLYQKRNTIVEKELIYDSLWQGEENHGALRVYMNSLKKVLGQNRFKNFRGVGYMMQI